MAFPECSLREERFVQVIGVQAGMKGYPTTTNILLARWKVNLQVHVDSRETP